MASIFDSEWMFDVWDVQSYMSVLYITSENSEFS